MTVLSWQDSRQIGIDCVSLTDTVKYSTQTYKALCIYCIYVECMK